MNTLVTISAIPPLTQSLYETMSCPRSYVTQTIEGRRLPGNLASWRGTEVHHVLSEYAWHCKETQQAADWAAFDHLASSVGHDAAEVLFVQRDAMQVDYEHLVFTELTLYLDENFRPVYEEDPGVVPPKAVYKATLDAGYRLNEIAFLIDDYKSHPQPFEPTTMQGLLYPLMVMQHKPEVQSVTFRLRFVRYRNLTREITWTRTDLPAMMAELRRARARQVSLHEAYRGTNAEPELPALPNPMCHYCPLLVNGGCPVANENPYKQNPKDLLFELRWLDERRAHVRGLLKDAEQAHGTIAVADANGNEMSFGTMGSDSEQYPAKIFLAKCSEWAAATNDWPLVDGLMIRSTSIKPKLKAKKRAALAQEIIDQKLTRTLTKTSTKLRMRNIGEEQDYANEYGAGEDE